MREFRIDAGGRRRYWVRERDPLTLLPAGNPAGAHDGEGWREYLGESVYSDLDVAVNFETQPPTATATIGRRYLHAGDGKLVGWQNAGGDWQIVHADHLGSTRMVTSLGGYVGTRLGYSAFGEILSQANPGGGDAMSRYAYCGGWGYETDALDARVNGSGGGGGGAGNPADAGWATTLGLLHVGARYYSPGIGRWVQRDAIGVYGGPNVYVYSFQCAISFVDPTGYDGAVIEMAGVTGIQGILNSLEVPPLAAAGLACGAIIAIAIWTADIDFATDQLGHSSKDMRKAIHKIKAACGLRPDDDIEIDTETGDVRIKGSGEDIGNIGQELGM